MSQSTDELTRSELRAIRGHYRRRVWLAFLIPALIAVALGWLLFQDKTPARPLSGFIRSSAPPTAAAIPSRPASEPASRDLTSSVAGLVRSGPPASYFPRINGGR